MSVLLSMIFMKKGGSIYKFKVEVDLYSICNVIRREIEYETIYNTLNDYIQSIPKTKQRNGVWKALY